MNLLPKRCLLAIAAVVDVAVHAAHGPVAAKALAERHDLPPRRLESLLQALVRADILKGVRGPRGGYELARERRRITAADIVRAVLPEDGEGPRDLPGSRLATMVVDPVAEDASARLLERLEQIRVEDMYQAAVAGQVFDTGAPAPDFTI